MFEYQYEPTPAETEIVLSEEPLNLIKEHIRSQFANPMEKKFDYVGSYIEKYKVSVMDIVTDDDEIELDSLNDEFIRFMLNIFDKYLDIGFPDFDTKSIDEQHEMIHMVYRYFIINIKHNFSSFCMNYIMKNKREIAENQPRKKDVTSLNLKKDVIDQDDITIVSNLYNIIDDIIFKYEHDIDLFIGDSDWKEPHLETEMIEDYYDDFSVVGNFYSGYRAMVNKEFIKEIECKVRNRILKPYKKKLGKDTIEEISEDISDE